MVDRISYKKQIKVFISMRDEKDCESINNPCRCSDCIIRNTGYICFTNTDRYNSIKDIVSKYYTEEELFEILL